MWTNIKDVLYLLALVTINSSSIYNCELWTHPPFDDKFIHMSCFSSLGNPTWWIRCWPTSIWREWQLRFIFFFSFQFHNKYIILYYNWLNKARCDASLFFFFLDNQARSITIQYYVHNVITNYSPNIYVYTFWEIVYWTLTNFSIVFYFTFRYFDINRRW